MALDLAVQSAFYLQCKLKFGFWTGETPPSQFYPAINFTKLGLTAPAQEIERLKSNMEGSVGQDLATMQKPTEDASVALAGNSTAPRVACSLWPSVPMPPSLRRLAPR